MASNLLVYLYTQALILIYHVSMRMKQIIILLLLKRTLLIYHLKMLCVITPNTQ